MDNKIESNSQENIPIHKDENFIPPQGEQTNKAEEQKNFQEEPSVTKTGNNIPDQFEEHIRSFLTEESAHQLTKRSIREKLAERLQLPIDEINNYKDEIHEIVAAIVGEIKSGGESQSPNIKGEKRKAEEAINGPTAKRLKTEAESENESSDASDESEKSSEDDHPKRRPKAKAKGVKATQGRMMTKSAFLENAKEYDCRVGELEFKLAPRLFSTGSCGWYFGGKFPFTIGDKEVTCTIGLNCTVVGSKTWSEGDRKKKK